MTTTKSAGSSAPRFKVGDEVWLVDGYWVRKLVVHGVGAFGIWTVDPEFPSLEPELESEASLFATSDELLENIKKQIEEIEK